MDLSAVELLPELICLDMLLSGLFSWFSSRWILFLTLRLMFSKTVVDLSGGFADVKGLACGQDDAIDCTG